VSERSELASERTPAGRVPRHAVSERDGDVLEGERDFLLRSLDDLESERADGAIDEESYRALHDDYTARAAAAIRALRDGVDNRPSVPVVPWRRRAVVIGAIVAFAAGSGVALAAALGARLPGQTSSGNAGAGSRGSQSSFETRRRQLEAAVERDPTDIGARLLLARFLEADNDLPNALRQYDEIIGLEPRNAEAYAQSGRLLYLTARAAPEQAAGLVDRSKARLDTAIDIDPGLADARYFRAIVLANEFQDFAGAQNDLQRYLIAAPNGRFADDARNLLAMVTRALDSSATTTSP
jgi:tetratricopeptide (TPR) repeat protein